MSITEHIRGAAPVGLDVPNGDLDVVIGRLVVLLLGGVAGVGGPDGRLVLRLQGRPRVRLQLRAHGHLLRHHGSPTFPLNKLKGNPIKWPGVEGEDRRLARLADREVRKVNQGDALEILLHLARLHPTKALKL